MGLARINAIVQDFLPFNYGQTWQDMQMMLDKDLLPQSMAKNYVIDGKEPKDWPAEFKQKINARAVAEITLCDYLTSLSWDEYQEEVKARDADEAAWTERMAQRFGPFNPMAEYFLE